MVRIARRPVPYARPTRLLLPLALLLGCIAVARTPTYAATITVGCDPVALIAAITTANATTEADTLSLAAGCTYTLTAADNGANGLPVITTPMTIQGNSATIERSDATGTPTFRLFSVEPGGALTLQAVTVRGGDAEEGGGIANAGLLTVERSTLSGNRADDFGGAISSDGTLTVANSTLSGNEATAGGGFGGGGGIVGSGTLTVTNSTFIGNSSGRDGGGIFNEGTLTVTNSSFGDNTADGAGGGIYNVGDLTVNASRFSANSTAGRGGGIGNWSTGTVTVSTSTFSGNSALDNGGGFDNQGTLTVENSTFSGNSAGEYGGAILNADTLTVTSSTLSGNSAGIASGDGGGSLYNEGDATFGNTIVAGSPQGGNCVTEFAITDSGGNLSSDATCGFTAASSQNSIDPLLGPLQDNGGPTQTNALLPGSPAIDAAVTCPPPATDQRGVTRPQGTACDSGAFEVVVPTPTPTSTPTPTATPTRTSTPTPTATPTPTLTATPGTTATPTLTATRGFLPLVLRAPRAAPTATATP